MVRVFIKTDSHYTVDRSRVRDKITDLLFKKGVKANSEVSIAVVGDRLMRTLNRVYRKVDETTDVLSFPLTESSTKAPFIDPPDKVLRLGDIIISYPQAIEESIDDNKLVDDKIDELVEHGLLHLLGQHHN